MLRIWGCAIVFYNVLMSIELLVSSQFLKNYERVIKIVEIIAASHKPIHVVQQQTDDPQVTIAYNKLKLVSHYKNTDIPILTIKLWCHSDILSETLMKNLAINVILSQDGQNWSEIANSNYLIMMRDIKQLRELFGMSIFQIERRCKMQKMMRISSARCQQNQSKQKIKTMGLKYAQRKYGKSLQMLLAFLRFNTKWYKERIKKCFNVWLIETYQKNIDKINQKIVKQQYFCQHTQKKLISRCFQLWKGLSVDRDKRHII